MAEEEDDFRLVEQGLISYKNKLFDLYDLYRTKDEEGNHFVFGRYEVKNDGLIVGRAVKEEILSYKMSILFEMRKDMKLNQTKGVFINIFEKDFGLN